MATYKENDVDNASPLAVHDIPALTCLRES
jgi:hypothetical protein